MKYEYESYGKTKEITRREALREISWIDSVPLMGLRALLRERCVIWVGGQNFIRVDMP